MPRHDESRDSTLSSTLILPRLALRRNLNETRFRTYHLSFQTDIIAFSCFAIQCSFDILERISLYFFYRYLLTDILLIQ